MVVPAQAVTALTLDPQGLSLLICKVGRSPASPPSQRVAAGAEAQALEKAGPANNI